MKRSVPLAQSESREPGLSAPADVARAARWLAVADIRAALPAIFWLTLGLFLSHAYVYGVIVPPPWIDAPDPLFPPRRSSWQRFSSSRAIAGGCYSRSITS